MIPIPKLKPNQMRSQTRPLTVCLVVLLVSLLLGCGQSAKFRLTFSVPAPVVEPLPVKIAMYYPDELKTYVHEETLDNYGDFRIDMTGSHQILFNTVFMSLFEEATEVSNFNEMPDDGHGLISPRVKEVQITIPQQTRSAFYEVWIQYELVLYDRDGQLVHQWPLSAYGKANKDNYSSLTRTSELALHDATESAMRDAAANMSFFLMRNSKIKQWIDSVNVDS